MNSDSSPSRGIREAAGPGVGVKGGKREYGRGHQQEACRLNPTPRTDVFVLFKKSELVLRDQEIAHESQDFCLPRSSRGS